MNRYYLNQKERMIINVIGILFLFPINKYLFGTIVPSFDNNSLWFLCAIINIILANHLLTPFFTKPVDSLSFSIVGFITLIMIRPLENWSTLSKYAHIAGLIYFSLIVIAVIISIFFKDLNNDKLRFFASSLKLLVEYFGSASVIFSYIFIFALFTFHFNSSKEILGLSLVYIVYIVQKPLTNIFLIALKVFNSKKIQEKILSSGKIVAYQEPNIILIKQDSEKDIPYMSCVIIKDEYSNPQLGYSLDFVGKSDGVLLRTIIVDKTNNPKIIQDCKIIDTNSAIFVKQEYFRQNDIEIPNKKIIGIVSPETTIDFLKFEIIKNDNIFVGSLIETYINDEKVIYQIINGITQEEIVQKKNTFGYISVLARKIGSWNDENKRFVPNKWLPSLNSHIYKCPDIDNVMTNSNAIGHFPNSNYIVEINDINSLVTHNTAILGILGIGKSMLSIEIVERLISNNIKVICLDLTNQYKLALIDFLDNDYENSCINRINEAGQQDRDNWDENPENGGSLENFVNAIRNDLSDLLENENNRNLKIYNPSQLFATRQRNEPRNYQVNGNWERAAPTYTMTPVEVTQIIAETILDIVSDEMTNRARVCLVLEEAHSLVPEFNSVVAKTDVNATSATARAILQGRKFGLGCLLITQRTANVTKSILNQCNNIFAMRTFDDTGKEFLSNYIGKDYTNVLPTIPERHAVFFGKASSCENPVLLRLNDREIFIQNFRTTNPINFPIIAKNDIQNNESEFEDDIPF